MTVTTTIPQQLVTPLEYTEVAYWSKLYDCRTALQCYGNVIAGAFAGAIPELDILAMNRVLGLGVEVAVKPEDIDRIIAFYKKAGTARFFIQLSPHIRQPELPQWLKDNGFRLYNNWVKLMRSADKPIPEVKSELRVISIGPSQATTYSDILCESFEWENSRLSAWLAGSIEKSGYRHYLVMHGEKAVGAGALHVMNQYASMAFAGTLPVYRGLGAQHLLLKARIQDAQQMGCTHFFAETAEEKPDKPVASYRNMKKFGFEPAYLRQNWLFEF